MIPELKQALHGRRKRKHKGVRNVCAFVHGRDGEQPKKGVVCACVCVRTPARDWDRNSGGWASLQVNLFQLNQPEKQTGLNTSSHGYM